MRMLFFRLLVVVFSFSFIFNANAASFLAACDENKSPSNCSANKLSFPKYKTANDATVPFKYKVDRGGLGDIDEDTAFDATVEVLDLWEAESNLKFEQVDGGKFGSDITVNNYDSILDPSGSLGFSPIVFDNDGSIVDEIIGTGAKNNVLGFAGAVFFTSSGGHITGIKESQSLFNGFLFRGNNSASVLNEFQTTILHEFAHMFGIDHTQGGNIEGFNSNSDLTDIPVMFPIAANPLVELQQDDIAAVRLGYPAGDESIRYGTINGRLLKNGLPVKGANIVAFKADENNPRKKSVACPSDVDGQGRGKFVLPNLEPGEYILRAEPLDSGFTEGSSVGIHEPINPSRMDTGFYQGDGESMLKTESLSTGVSQALRISVSAGSTTNVQFDIGSNPSTTTNGEASFSLSGKAFNDAVYLRVFRSNSSRFKITNLNPGQMRNLQISTNYPDLISFSKETVAFTKPFKKLDVSFENYSSFLEIFPELETEGEVFIPLRVEDLDTGYVDESQGFIVY